MHMTFENGWTVSVQWSDYHYCTAGMSAEVAAWDTDGEWLQWSNGDTVRGWASPEEVTKLLHAVSQIHPAKQADHFQHIDSKTLELRVK